MGRRHQSAPVGTCVSRTRAIDAAGAEGVHAALGIAPWRSPPRPTARPPSRASAAPPARPARPPAAAGRVLPVAPRSPSAASCRSARSGPP
eukprot:scaffold52227_cov57-Phaeocystis_antarctica.AAC.1